MADYFIKNHLATMKIYGVKNKKEALQQLKDQIIEGRIVCV